MTRINHPLWFPLRDPWVHSLLSTSKSCFWANYGQHSWGRNVNLLSCSGGISNAVCYFMLGHITLAMSKFFELAFSELLFSSEAFTFHVLVCHDVHDH